MAGQVDAGSVETIVRDVLAGLPAGATTEARVLALYRYVREHLFAYISTNDDRIESLNKALLTLNWWGWGLCGRQAKTLAVLAAHLLGSENVRLVGLTEREHGAWRVGEAGRPYAFHWSTRTKTWTPDQLNGHTSLEIRWDGTWHFLDAMVGFYRRLPDAAGRIVSIEEIAANPSLADQPVGDPLHGDMPYGPEVEVFTKSQVKVYAPGINVWAGELPALNLRPGERLTFLAGPMPDEWIMHPKMRAIATDEALAGGPREGRPHAPAGRYGNAEHVYQVDLTADPTCPWWQPDSSDWSVPADLPYPIASIHWGMGIGDRALGIGGQESGGETVERNGCSGFLNFPPSTGDELLPADASGSHRPGPDATVGRSYRLIVRGPGKGCAVRLTLRTIVMHNPRVQPSLKIGRNVIRLAARAEGSRERLIGRVDYKLDGVQKRVELIGAGEHEVIIPPGQLSEQSITLENVGN